jgi:hypothetical protein
MVNFRSPLLESIQSRGISFYCPVVVYIYSPTYVVSIYAVSDVPHFKQNWKYYSNFFKSAPNCRLRDWKRSLKLAEQYCWAMTQAAGRSFCFRSGSQGVGSSDYVRSIIHWLHPHLRLESDVSERNHCVSRGVSGFGCVSDRCAVVSVGRECVWSIDHTIHSTK